MWFIKKNEVKYAKLPKHIAFIMDGNGRWAQRFGMPRNYGHKCGVDTVKTMVKSCAGLGIRVVSFFVFSSENWGRPKEEVDYIFGLAKSLFENERLQFDKNNYKLMVSGDVSALDEDIQSVIFQSIEKTKNNTGMIINFAVNYGGRNEILTACKKLFDSKEEITMQNFEKHLYTMDLPDPDIVIRTSGEKRISNFMLYQMAYSELFFPKKYWPEFKEKDLLAIINEYQTRNRRYGKLN